MRDAREALRATLLGTILVAAAPAHGARYPGMGDTGWSWTSKRECCNAAIDLAIEESATFCLQAGGQPRPSAGDMQRGSCSWQWMQDPYSGELVYRCTSRAAIWCR